MNSKTEMVWEGAIKIVKAVKNISSKASSYYKEPRSCTNMGINESNSSYSTVTVQFCCTIAN